MASERNALSAKLGCGSCWIGIVAMAKSKCEAACHEAGHALCGVLSGLSCKKAMIKLENDGWLGQTSIDLPEWFKGYLAALSVRKWDGSHPDYLQTVGAWFVYLAGGAIAEYQVMGTQLPKSPEAHEDWNRIHDTVDRITRNEDEYRAVVDRVIWRAAELLIKHRRALDALACAIAKRKHLSGEEVKAIIAQATGAVGSKEGEE